MKKTNTLYWVSTALFAGFMLFSAIPDILVVQPAVEMVSNQLGYPKYLIPFLGVAKLLGAVAILIPRFPRLKEWAYAGLFFDLAGALYSSIATGSPVSQWIFMAIPFGVFALSYVFWHKKQSISQQGKESFRH
jgi:uncharacterized membrane protein YphA (DoxX/SURF4 family)